MRLVTIPRGEAGPFRALWVPFLRRLAEHSKEGEDTVEAMAAEVDAGFVQVHLALDSESVVKAFFGTKTYQRHGKQIGELSYCSGFDLAEWEHLFSDLFAAMKDWDGAQQILVERARPGWRRILARHGLKTKYMTFGRDV